MVDLDYPPQLAINLETITDEKVPGMRQAKPGEGGRDDIDRKIEGVSETFRTNPAGMSPARPRVAASRKRVLRREGNRSGEA